MASRLLGALLLALLAVPVPAAGPEINPPLPTGTLTIAGRVTVTVELARSPLEQTRGLSHRPRLAEGRGMAFVYVAPQPVGIWMKDMRFPLDILWVREGRIVKIEKAAPPLAPGAPERVYTATADLVLEVPAGFTDRARVRVGDRVTLRAP
ncbi:MAG: DUF192 domain-containing protein [Candidatus Methylomirabilales bacterium]